MRADTMTYTQAPIAPNEPAEGDMWWNSETGKMFRWIDGRWVERLPPTVTTGPVETVVTADLVA